MSVYLHRALGAPAAVLAGIPLAGAVLLGLAIARGRHPKGSGR